MKRTTEIEAIRTVARNPYAWPGGYPVGLVMYDGEVLCSTCVKANYRMILERTRDNDRDDWSAVGHQVYEGTEEDHGRVECIHCGHVLVGEPRVYVTSRQACC